MIYFNLHFDEITPFPAIYEYIKIDNALHVTLQFKGSPIPLPEWL